MTDIPILCTAPVPATTIWQPYASLIAIGAKRFETRAYPPPAKHLGKRIAIHAAARLCSRVMDGLDGHVSQDICAAFEGADIDTGDLDLLPRGAVVCTAVLKAAYHVFGPAYDGWVAVEECRLQAPIGVKDIWQPDHIQTDPFGDYSSGRWAWLLTDIEALKDPAPAKGKQGWWKWNPIKMEREAVHA
jgi:activating signal cointegrator 1